MTLKELYDVSPCSFVFVVQREEDFRVKGMFKYKGDKTIANRKVKRITAASYPMYKSVLEVEIEY